MNEGSGLGVARRSDDGLQRRVRARRLLLSASMGVALLVGVAALFGSVPERAMAWPPGRTPGPAFVKAGEPMSGTTGTCYQNDPCGSIQYAVDESVGGNGDTIYVAQGTYTGTEAQIVKATKSITLYGGWDGGASGPVSRDPALYSTILDAESGGRVAYITGTVAVVLDGLTLQGGDATGLVGDPWGFDVGGALYANSADLTVVNCRVLSSAAEFGAGLALYHGTPRLANNTIAYNTASLGGGGIYLDNTPADVLSNTVMHNTAAGSASYQGGGGLYLNRSPAMIQGNTIQANQATASAGGIFLYESDARVEDNAVRDNDALNLQGGGLTVYSSTAVIRGNLIEDNDATTDGGGVFAIMSALDLEANTILDNQAILQMGGGLCLVGCSPFTLTNNIVARNYSQDRGPALLVGGCIPTGCPGVYHSRGTLLHNTFADNSSSVYSLTIHVGESSGGGATVVFTNTLVDVPGGVAVDSTGVVIMNTTLWHPTIPTVSMAIPPGVVSTQGDLYGVPRLTGSYHLGGDSAAIDRAANTGLDTDIDGNQRPEGRGPDIGADETLRVFLPLALRAY